MRPRAAVSFQVGGRARSVRLSRFAYGELKSLVASEHRDDFGIGAPEAAKQDCLEHKPQRLAELEEPDQVRSIGAPPLSRWVRLFRASYIC